MKQTAAERVRAGHVWTASLALRAFLAVSALVSMVLASGAGSHWH